MEGASTMTILEYFSGVAMILGSLMGTMGLSALILRFRRSH
jgi:hypothetical protein